MADRTKPRDNVGFVLMKISTTRRLHFAQLVAMTLAAMLLCAGCVQKPEIAFVPDDDPEMAAAIAKARNTLPQFWSVFENPTQGEKDFALKVRFTDAKGYENLWLSSLQRSDGKITGVVDNYPNTVTKVRRGERIDIPETDITDWFYMRDGKMFGNQTIRILFRKMTPSEVEYYKNLLAEP
jgi:uncharacterized protein YegJ (DUF2314 family)